MSPEWKPIGTAPMAEASYQYPTEALLFSDGETVKVGFVCDRKKDGTWEIDDGLSKFDEFDGRSPLGFVPIYWMRLSDLLTAHEPEDAILSVPLPPMPEPKIEITQEMRKAGKDAMLGACHAITFGVDGRANLVVQDDCEVISAGIYNAMERARREKEKGPE